MAEACSSSDEFSDADDVDAFYSEVDRIQEDLNVEVKNARDLLAKWQIVKKKHAQKEVYCVLEDMFNLMIELPFQDISPLILNGTPFIVSGDMLVMYAMANGNWNMHYGGHTLHLVYLCERVLNFFVQKGGKFHIVFFKVWKRVFEKYPMMLLARSVLFLHFENNSQFQVHSFHSVSSKEFSIYLNTYRSSFMLVNLDFVEHAIYIFGKTLFPIVGLTFYMELFTALCLLPCVDLSNLKLDVSTLDAFVATPMSSFEKLWNVISNDLNGMWNIHEKNLNCVINIDNRKITEVLKDVDIHKFVACLSCAQLLLEDDIYDDLVKSYLVYCSIIKVLPLRFRPCNFDLTLPEHVNNFISKLQYCMHTALIHSMKYDVDCKLVGDVWQGNLYSAILYYLNFKYYSQDLHSILNDCTIAHYRDLVNKIVALTGRPLNMAPVLKDKLLWQKLSAINVKGDKATNFSTMSSESSSSFLYQTGHKSKSCHSKQKSSSGAESKQNKMLSTYGKNENVVYKVEDIKATKSSEIITWEVDEVVKKARKKKKKKKNIVLLNSEETKNDVKNDCVNVNRNSIEDLASLCKEITSLYEDGNNDSLPVSTQHIENSELYVETLPCVSDSTSDLNIITSRNENNSIVNVKCILHEGDTASVKSKKVQFSESIHKDDGISIRNRKSMQSLESNGSDMYLQKLLPVSCELYTSFCGSVLIDPVYMEDREVALLQGFINSNARFDETCHWHSKQPITDELDRTKNTDHKISGKKTKYQMDRLQRDQVKYKSFLSFYGRSLEGDSFYSKPIVCKLDKKDHVQKPKISNKAQKIIDDNQKAKSASKENTDKQKYEHFEKLFVSWKESGDYQRAISYLEMLEKSIKSPQWLSKVLMYKGELCFKMWKSECEINKKLTDRNINHAKKLFLAIRDALCLLKSSANLKDVSEKIGMWLCSLGFKDICSKWNLPVTEKNQSKKLNVGMSYIRFQLGYLGADLERDTGAAEDSRVDGFLPDKWQRDLFDIVDKKESALIVAPTSSGKTYASYYCMRKVLEESNDGVVVYVSPTKALVNQVHATVYARFRNKIMPTGRAVCGVFTRDYRYKVLESQILITVPQCLELLLLSPRQYDWTRRLRYVIFDEIHCLAGQAGGISWERCLLLIRCPFLALSATVGEPENFYTWLQDMEHFKQDRDKAEKFVKGKASYRVHLVKQEGRHSDLVKHVYKEGLIHHIHPYSLLDELVVEQNNGIPSHISLSPHETLRVYDALLAVYPKSEEVKHLCPEKYFSFSETGFLTRNSVREYENEVRVLLGNVAVQCKNKFQAVKSYLTPNISFKKLTSGDTYSVKNVSQIIQLLHNSNMLPALFFLYNREAMELLFEGLTMYYDKNVINDEKSKPSVSKKRGTVVKKTSRETSVVKKNWSEYTGVPIDMCCKIDPKSLKKAGFSDKDYKVVQKKPVVDSLPSLYLLKGNNFLKGVGVADENDIRLIEKRLVLSGYEYNDMFIKGLRLGLGIHHAGKSAKERGSVEMMFRMGLLRSVFATGTLALGIHMPCKTVVILGDSQYINSLEYHQMSGRAGRRGFDTCGNVIFAGLGKRKLQTLVTDKLPAMIGNFPLSVGTVLRLLLLVSRVTSGGVQQRKVTEDALSRALTLLNCSMVYRVKPELKTQMKHFFQFSTQLLVLQGLIDENGSPQDLTGIVTHLHYHEPGNVAFVFLFRCGALRRLCEANKNKPVPLEIQFNLITVLSYLFGCVPLHRSVLKREFVNSTVIMDKPPRFIKQTFDEYNKQVKFLFNKYFQSVAADCIRNLHADNKLPLTNITFGSGDDYCLAFKENTLEKELIDACVPRKICSVFAALSGNDDSKLYSSDDLVSNIRHQIFTDIKIIPLINYDWSFNSYALDFYKHGIASAIRRDNGLKAGEDFTRLKDFLLVLKTITTSLEELQPLSKDDPILRAFRTVTERFNRYFQHAYSKYSKE